MKIYWMLALAASSITVAGAASAANWVRFTASGNGYATEYDRFEEDQIPTSVWATFEFAVTVDTDPWDSDEYVSESNSFYKAYPNGDEIFVGTSPGRLNMGYGNFHSGNYIDPAAAISAIFSPTLNPQGYPTKSVIYTTGSASYTDYNSNFDGTVNRLTIERVSGFEDPNFSISAAAVPEPSSWGMMILGFGIVGAGMRRRKTTLVAA